MDFLSGLDFLLNTYRLHLQYDGSNYYGWQTQPNVPTIQGELNKAIESFLKSNKFKTIGAGRTDKGVHALDQVVKLAIEHEIPLEQIKMGVNRNLPGEINIQSLFRENGDYHPIRDTNGKEYHYFFAEQVDSTHHYQSK